MKEYIDINSFDNRVKNCLMRYDLFNDRKLFNFLSDASDNDILKLQNMGRKSLSILRRWHESKLHTMKYISSYNILKKVEIIENMADSECKGIGKWCPSCLGAKFMSEIDKFIEDRINKLTSQEK